MRDADAFLISRLRFRHLKVIETLGSVNSIRKAAQALHLSEPAVSKALTEIETSFGFTLFERSASGVVITPRGQAAVEGAVLLLNSLRQLRRAASAIGQGVALRVGAVPFVGLTLLPRLFRLLLDQGSPVRISLLEGTGPRLFELLHEGEIDAMLATLSPEVLRGHSAIAVVHKPLFRELLTIIAPREHRLVGQRHVMWEDLVAERWILPSGPSETATTVRDAFLSRGLAYPDPWIESMGLASSIEFVAAGLGICAVPLTVARASRRRGLIAELKVEPAVELPPVCFTYRTADAQASSIRLLQHAINSMKF